MPLRRALFLLDLYQSNDRQVPADVIATLHANGIFPQI